MFSLIYENIFSSLKTNDWNCINASNYNALLKIQSNQNKNVLGILQCKSRLYMRITSLDWRLIFFLCTFPAKLTTYFSTKFTIFLSKIILLTISLFLYIINNIIRSKGFYTKRKYIYILSVHIIKECCMLFFENCALREWIHRQRIFICYYHTKAGLLSRTPPCTKDVQWALISDLGEKSEKVFWTTILLADFDTRNAVRPVRCY